LVLRLRIRPTVEPFGIEDVGCSDRGLRQGYVRALQTGACTVKVGELKVSDCGELWRVVSVDPLIMRRVRDGRIASKIGEKW